MYQKTYEPIIEPENPIAVSDLEIKVGKGSPLTLATDRPELYQEVLAYWNAAQVRIAEARSDEIISALQSKDNAKISKIFGMIGGVGPSHRLSRASLEGNTLSLDMSGSNYMEFIGTNEQATRNPDFRKRLMEAGLEDHNDENAYFANGLAACTVINGIGDDGDLYAAVALRSNKVAIYPNVHHVFGGLAKFDEKRQHLSLGSHAQREVQEETGLSDNEFGPSMFYGIVRQNLMRHPEAVLGVPLFVSKDELIDRWKNKAPDKFENRKISFYSTSEIPQFLETYGPAMVPSGAAALQYVMKYQDRLKELASNR